VCLKITIADLPMVRACNFVEFMPAIADFDGQVND
jgi:hypothetical protein